MSKIVVIGPFPNPVHGCSLANEVLVRGLIKRGISCHVINMATDFSEQIGSFSIKKVLNALKKYLSVFKVVQCKVVYLTPGQSYFGVLKYAPFIIVAYLARKQIIFHVHGNHLCKEYKLVKPYKKRIMNFIISLSTKGIVLSPSLRVNLSPFLPEDKIFSVFNFAENYLYDSSLKKSFNNLNVVYLSNLMTEKGILDLLDALKQLKDKDVMFEAKIAGAIAKETTTLVLEKIECLGERVNYLGTIYGKNKKELLQWGNVFVFPTYYPSEGQPISLIEAMATGNAIVTTKHAGIPDILTEQNAFFVDAKSPTQIADTLAIFYINNQKFREKSQFNIYDSIKYSEDSYVNNILRVIND